METMKIGEFARRAGVNVQTVRYYERRGLLPEPARWASGYREYTAGCLERLRFIRRSQELGFTLGEIEELLALRTNPQTSAAEVRARAEAKVADIQAKIRDLQTIQRALEHLAGQCRGGEEPTGDCPLLAAMGPLGAACATHPSTPSNRRQP